MATLTKLAAILLVVSAWGALQFAVPEYAEFNSEQAAIENNSSSKTKVEFAFSYEQESKPVAKVVVDDYQHVKEGSFFFKQNDPQLKWRLSPLLNTDLKLNISGLVARAKLTQTFTNDSEDWVNGIYVFPLPTDAAVDHLEMRIGNRVIEGQIHTKSKARKIYQQAKRAGKKASLLEQQRPNLFVNSVANIGPGESIEVSIEYQQPVHFNDGQFSLRFPMTITPRYMPTDFRPLSTSEQGWTSQEQEGPSQQHSEYSATFSDERANQISISAHINAGLELSSIDSEFHQIHTESLAEGIYAVTLADNAIANKDFILSWKVESSDLPQAAHFQQSVGDEKYGLVMLVPPKFEQQQDAQIARQMTFILDTSGSMAGEPLRQAKSALQYAIAQLTARDHFNLIEFNSHARSIWSFARAATKQNKQSANDFINGLESNGGTNMLSALALAMKSGLDSEHGGVTQIIFITDGSVGNDTALLAYIKSQIQGKRLFTVGIGAAPNGYFMQEAARVGRGTFTFIGSVTGVDEKMQALFNKIRFPILTDLAADFASSVEFYPSVIPDLYLGEPLMLSYRTPDTLDKVFISGHTEQQNWAVELDAHSAAENTGLDVLWARRKIAQLSRDRLTQPNPAHINQQIEQLALTHHLVSEFTSLVAVDITPTALDASQDRQVPSNTPSPDKTNTMVGKLPRTATSGPMHLLVSLLLLGGALCCYMRKKQRH